MSQILLRLRDGNRVEVSIRGYVSEEDINEYIAICRAAQCRLTPSNTRVGPLSSSAPLLQLVSNPKFVVTIDPGLMEKFEQADQKKKASLRAIEGRFAEIEAASGRPLFEYQKDGARWLAGHSTIVLGDDMGLGKTRQAIAAMPANAATIVICPASAKGVWASEVKLCKPETVITMMSGRGNFKWPMANEVVIVNYDILPGEKEKEGSLTIEPPKGCPNGVTLICDEAHRLRKRRSLRALRVRGIINKVLDSGGSSWALTGTPLLNRPTDLWNVLGAFRLASLAFGTSSDFRRLFGLSEYGEEGEETRDSLETVKVSPEVPMRLRKVMLRRMKDDYLGLPPKRRQQHAVDLDRGGRAACEELDAILRKHGIDVEKASSIAEVTSQLRLALHEISGARAAIATAKIPFLMDMVESFEEEEQPALVFSAHRAPILALQGRQGWATIIGGVDAMKRKEIEAKFQEGKLIGVAGTIGAMSEAITLTRAGHVLFVDRSWTFKDNQQAEDRAHRIGQNKSILIHDLLLDHKIEHRLYELLVLKESLSYEAIDKAAVKGETPEQDALAIAKSEVGKRKEVLEKVKKAAVYNGYARVIADTYAKNGALTAKQWEIAAKIAEEEKR